MTLLHFLQTLCLPCFFLTAGDERTSSFEESLETIHKPQASYDNLLQNKVKAT